MSYAGQDPGDLSPDELYGGFDESADEMNGTESGFDEDTELCPLCGGGDTDRIYEYAITCASCGVVHLARKV